MVKPVNQSASLIGLTGLTGLTGFSTLPFAVGFRIRTFVLFLLFSDNDLEVVILTGELPSMLSKRQHHILRFIHQHTLEDGFAPSIREISMATGITSTSVANYNLERLIAWGYLVKSRGKSRTSGLTERGSALVEPNQSVKIKRVGERFPVDELLDANLPDRDTINCIKKTCCSCFALVRNRHRVDGQKAPSAKE